MSELDPIYAHCLRHIESSGDVQAAMESEWSLSRRFGVSRPAARRVMQRLVREGLAVAIRGKGYFTRPPQRGQRRGTLRVAIVFERTPSRTAAMQNRVLGSLLDAIRRRRSLDATLLPLPTGADRLTILSRAQANPADAYLLYSLPPAVQSQFAAQHRPAVVFGNTYAELGLPSVALDELDITRNICEDALRKARRCIALVQQRSQNLGAERSRLGFIYAHHAQRRRFNNDRVVIADPQRGGRPALWQLHLLRPDAILVQNADLLRWLWDRASAQQRSLIASADVTILAGQSEGLPIPSLTVVRADLDAAARVVGRLLRDALRAQHRAIQHHSIPWTISPA